MNQTLFPQNNPLAFNSSNVSFGRHASFAVRYGWLSKGFQLFQKDTAAFAADDATIALGVGKNMVDAIKYWLRATQLVDTSFSQPTPLGCLFFDRKAGLDPYLEDEATVWVLHWLLASNPSIATANFWFFNQFHKAEFSGDELATALADFTRDQVAQKRRPSSATVKKDAQLLTRMYVQSRSSGRAPLEDALDSPLSLLGLVSQSSVARTFRSPRLERSSLPPAVLGFALTEILNAKNINMIPIEELMQTKDSFPAPGSIFRLTESDILQKIEQLIEGYPHIFEIRETAGIHQLYLLSEVDPILFLNDHYKSGLASGVAA